MSEFIDRMLKSSKHEEQSYNACAGILHSDKDLPHGILEEAARQCVDMKSYIKQLEQEGFILEDPEFLENYCPSYYPCNAKKGNDILSLPELRRLHEKASKTVPNILKYVKARV